MSTESTLRYYADHTSEFIEGTMNADVSDLYKRFERYIEPGDSILDLGFGSGRDSLYYHLKHYQITSVDGSQELCNAAPPELPRVRCLTFQELDYVESFDAVWACASLLHVPKAEMDDVFRKVIRALRDRGVFYVSYKYGEAEREVDGRLFSDYTEDSFNAFLESFPDLELLEMWVTDDVRPDRTEKWLNAILKKRFKPAVTETEFRIQFSKAIERYQLIEMRLRDIGELLIAKDGKDWLRRINDESSDAMWSLIDSIQKRQKKEKLSFFSDDDFSAMHRIRLSRNYWCHECFGGSEPVTFVKPKGCTERIVGNKVHAERLANDLTEAYDMDKWLTEEFLRLKQHKGVTPENTFTI